MLSIADRDKIRKINLFCYSSEEKDGKPIKMDGSEFTIPPFMDLKQIATDEILNSGFSSVETVEPSNANCIIRVFKKLHHPHDDTFYNAYGYCCYTRLLGEWNTSPNGMDYYPLNPSKFKYRISIFQDEYVELNLGFFDCYVKIS